VEELLAQQAVVEAFLGDGLLLKLLASSAQVLLIALAVTVATVILLQEAEGQEIMQHCLVAEEQAMALRQQVQTGQQIITGYQTV
jgi:hypothetical protein